MSNVTINYTVVNTEAGKSLEWLSPDDVFTTVAAIECIGEFMEEGELRDEVVAGLREELSQLETKAADLCKAAILLLDKFEDDSDRHNGLLQVIDIQQRNLRVISDCNAGKLSQG
jgi:hypothetical protein